MDERNVLIKIRGEADMTEAQQQLATMVDRGRELEKQLASVAKQEQANQNIQKETAKVSAAEKEQIDKLLEGYRQMKEELAKQVALNRQAIDQVQRAIESYKSQSEAQKKAAKQAQEFAAEEKLVADMAALVKKELEGGVKTEILNAEDLAKASTQLDLLSKNSKRLAEEMNQLQTAEANLIARQQAIVETSGKEDAKLNELIADSQRMRNEAQQEINTNNQNIASLKRAISSYQAMQGEVNRAAQQIRAIREELASMEMAGDTSSQRFIDLSVQAARLTDQMGDTQKQIRILASDTANLDAAMSIGGGLAGVFSTATSAAALLGDENDALQKSFLQVQAAMAVLNGVQQVANTLNKDSAANVVIRTALNKLFTKEKAKETTATITSTTASVADAGAKTAQTVATNAATTATNKLTLAMMKNPAGILLVAIAALVAGLITLKNIIDKNSEKQRKFNNELERTKKIMDTISYDTSLAVKMAEAEGKGWQEVLRIQREGAKKQLEEADNLVDELEKKAKGKYSKLSDTEKQKLSEAREMQKEAWKRLIEIDQEGVVTEAKVRIDGERSITESKISAMDEGLPKTIAEIRYQYKERIKEIKGNTKEEIALRSALEYEMQRKIAKVKKDKYTEYDKQLKAIEIALMDEGLQKRLAEIEQGYNQQIKAITGNNQKEIAIRAGLEKEKQKMLAKAKAEAEKENVTLNIQSAIARAEADKLYDIKADLMKAQAKLEIDYINSTISGEAEKAAKIESINTNLYIALEQNAKDKAKDSINTAKLEAESILKVKENEALRILLNDQSTLDQKKVAAEELKNHELAMMQIREDELKSLYGDEVITYAEYQTQKLDIERERLEKSLAEQEAYAQKVREMTESTLNFFGEMSSIIFGAISDNISQQLEDLDNLYTTDAEEAKEDADKKYITEKELANKKLALQQKQARLDKAEAVFQIGLSTAMAIMRIWADVPKVDFGVSTGILTAMAAAVGAAQIAAALAKPLPQYAKGRKGGKGEYAIVGERGAEMMYIPEGASIVPHNKLNDPEAWGAYGVPAMPDFDAISLAGTFGGSIDYDRLGKAVAANLPKQKAVSVNVDRNGVLVSEEYGSTKYLNQKYTGRWI